MRISKTEQHLYSTMKKILKNHFYELQSAECYSDYKVGQVIYLIRFYERIGVHGKRDISIFDVYVKDTRNIEFDIVAVGVTKVGKSDVSSIALAEGIKHDNECIAKQETNNLMSIDPDMILTEFIWEVGSARNPSKTNTFIDLRAFIKGFFVIKNVVKVNDTINERIMLEVLNHHV